jgi:hypothetical protein
MIVAVFAIIADAEQYFSTDSAMARLTFSAVSPCDRSASDYESGGQEFESSRARQQSTAFQAITLEVRSNGEKLRIFVRGVRKRQFAQLAALSSRTGLGRSSNGANSRRSSRS